MAFRCIRQFNSAAANKKTADPNGSTVIFGAAIRFAVPEKIFGLPLSLDFFDRCTPMSLLHLPLAAQRHWAKFSLASPVQICCSE
jgi:hypothetical protein